MPNWGLGCGFHKADKKLIQADGQPLDLGERRLIEDARQAVKELDRDGIFIYCIGLAPKVDEYVADIFGRQYTVVDNIQRLPEKLPFYGVYFVNAIKGELSA